LAQQAQSATVQPWIAQQQPFIDFPGKNQLMDPSITHQRDVTIEQTRRNSHHLMSDRFQRAEVISRNSEDNDFKSLAGSVFRHYDR
jgi:hypothetical protein